MKNIFRFIEKSVVKINDWKHIPSSKRKMLYICPHEHKGEVKNISDGTIIKNGDLVAEIHIDNLKIHKIENDFRNLSKVFREELQALGDTIVNEETFKDIKAYHGTTLLYSFAKREGFTIIDIHKGTKTYFLSIWENILRIVFKKDQRKRNKFRAPKECWISKEQLLEKYIKTQGEVNVKEKD